MEDRNVQAVRGTGGARPFPRELVAGAIDAYNPWPVAFRFPIYLKPGRLIHEQLSSSMGLRLDRDDGAVATQVQHDRFRTPVDYLVLAPEIPPASWTHIAVTAGEPGVQERISTVQEDGCSFTLRSGELVLRIDARDARPLSFSYHNKEMLGGPADVDFNAMFRIEEHTIQCGPVFAEVAFRIRVLEPGYRFGAGGGRLRRDLTMVVRHRIYEAGKYEFWVDDAGWSGDSPWVGMEMRFSLSVAGLCIPGVGLDLTPPEPGIDFRDFGQSVRSRLRFFQNGETIVARREEEVRNGRRYRATLFMLPPEARDCLPMWVRLIDEGTVVQTKPVQAVVSRRIEVSYSGNHPLIRQAATDLKERLGNSGAAPPGLAVELAVETPRTTLTREGWELWLENSRYKVRGTTPHALGQAVDFLRRHCVVDEERVALPLASDTCVAAVRGVCIGGMVTEVDFCKGNEAAWEAGLSFLAKAGVNRVTVMPMWGTWKLPCRYRAMPELRSASGEDFDWVGYLPFKDIDAEAERGIRLIEIARRLGFELYTEVVVGRVPETFAVAYPDAVVQGARAIPCSTHPAYLRFLHGYLKELRESYGLDGFVLNRDDFCEMCRCPRCLERLSRSPYNSSFWDLCVDLHEWVKASLPETHVAVYPYNDYYRSEIDPALPRDLLILGHGSGETVLARADDVCAPHGDTWLDNVLIGFRVPPAPAMKQLLSDRNAMWTGGWLEGNEATWASIGTFGWDPEVSIESLRFALCRDLFPDLRSEIAAVEVLGSYEQLREWFNHALLPRRWLSASAGERDVLAREVSACVEQVETGLARLGSATGWTGRAPVSLFALFIRYHLQRLDLLFQEFTGWRPAHDTLREAIAEGRDADVVVQAELLARLAERQNELVRGFAGTLRERGGEVYEAIVREHFAPGARAQLDRMGFENDITYMFPGFPFDAHVVGHGVPARMIRGKTYAVSVTVQNLSSRPWEVAWDSLVLIGLGGTDIDVPLPSGYVRFGEVCVVPFSVTAPTEPGTYRVQIGMHVPRQLVPIYGKVEHTVSIT
jgi:hypothetical protein